MNIKQLTELTAYLNTISEDDQGSISIGACFDGYIFVEDYFGDILDAQKMHDMGYVYINSEKWWALEEELPA
jgi:hypothetical protein